MKCVKTINTMDNITSGILSLDLALGKGLPRNKIIELSGPPDSSKSTFVFNLIKANDNCVIAYIDTDNRININYVINAMDIDPDSFIVAQPHDAEQLLEVVSTLLKSHEIDIIVIDSLASVVSYEEQQTSMSKTSNNNTLSDTIKKLSSMIYKSDCALILVNQIRNDLKAKRYGAETTLANRILNSYASIRLDIRKTNEIHKYDQIIGSKLKITITKNKVTPKKQQSVSISHIFNKGLDTLSDLIDLACEANIINKSAAWYSYDSIKVQGKQSLINCIEDNDDLLEELYDKVFKYYKL